jgi:hypothetical protein
MAGGDAIRSERLSSIPQLLRSTSMSHPSLHMPEEARAQIAAMKKSLRRGTDWSVLFRRMRPSQQQSAIANNFQMRMHNATDLAVAALEALIVLASALQLGLTYKTAFWVSCSIRMRRIRTGLRHSCSQLCAMPRSGKIERVPSATIAPSTSRTAPSSWRTACASSLSCSYSRARGSAPGSSSSPARAEDAVLIKKIGGKSLYEHPVHSGISDEASWSQTPFTLDE